MTRSPKALSLVPPSPLAVGDLVDGRYEVCAHLGEGGLGNVYDAVDRQAAPEAPRVALKILKADWANDTFVRERFVREATAAASLVSPHTCGALASGVHRDGRPYLVMERLVGRTLGERLDAGGPLDPIEAVAIALDVCTALDEAHAHGIVHRDIKPDNVFLATAPDGRTTVKVIDFGLSKQPGISEMTGARDLLGTPHYMSPEQVMTPRDVDGQTDLWALGVTLFEMLTGERPFKADSTPQLVMKIVLEAPRSLDEIPGSARPVGHPALAVIVGRCLEKRRHFRYANAAALANDLRGVLGLLRTAPPARVSRRAERLVDHRALPTHVSRQRTLVSRDRSRRAVPAPSFEGRPRPAGRGGVATLVSARAVEPRGPRPNPSIALRTELFPARVVVR